jgi:ABC-type Zn uptake system ZnuABC Zn-binding protein ZnuA
MKNILLSLLIFSGLFVSGCQVVQPPASQKLTVLAIEPFLADITANVAGDRVEVQSLIPSGVDPHSFELTPQDVAKLEKADVLVLNGGGLEQFLEPVLSQKTAKVGWAGRSRLFCGALNGGAGRAGSGVPF